MFRLSVKFGLPERKGWPFFESIIEPSNRATTPTYRWTIKALNSDYRSGETSLTLLEEDYVMIYFGMVFKPFSPFFEIFNEVLGRMEANGLMQLYRESFYFFAQKRKLEDIGPQILTMDHLRVGFLACCVPLILSVIAFIGEKVWSRFVIAVEKYLQRVCRKKLNLIFRVLRSSVEDILYEPEDFLLATSEESLDEGSDDLNIIEIFD